MRWFVLSIGGVTAAAMLCISMRVNFLFGYALGQTPERAEVFGWVSVISDFWKALGPIFIVALFRAKKSAAVVASFIWAACLLYSITSAVGAAIEDRSSRAGNRETIVMDYDEFTAEAKLLEEKRSDLRKHRPAPIVEAAITALLMRPVESSRRAPSTIGEVSANCQHTDQRATDACAEVAQLREELATAKEENDLNREIAKLKAKARELRERGAIKSSDPQADLLAGLTGGWLSPRDVGRALALLLAMTIEFVSAFGPIVLKSYAEATERCHTARRDKASAATSLEKPAETPGLVIDYLAERIEPGTNTDTLSQSALYADYAAWCRSSNLAALSARDFVTSFDQLRAENGLAKIRKRKSSYCGIRLAASHETPATA
jgi:hypothetical protein